MHRCICHKAAQAYTKEVSRWLVWAALECIEAPYAALDCFTLPRRILTGFAIIILIVL